MPRPRSKSLILSVLSGILVYSIPAIAAEPPWLEIHSTHFTVISDAGDKKGREVALRFEQMRAVFANLLGKERLNQPVPLTILAYRNDKSYYQIAPLRDGQPISVPGFFLSGDDQDFIVLNLVEEESWRAVARDFAAVLLNYNYPPAQQWFDDGLAEYFSSIHVNDKQVEIGGDPGVHATVSNSAGNQAGIPASASLSQLLAGQNWLSLTDLFSRKNDTSAGNEAASPTLYDAESWIVMHYVLRENKLPETGAYFGLVLNQHVPVEEAVQELSLIHISEPTRP